jgi:thioester reductase-like protein
LAPTPPDILKDVRLHLPWGGPVAAPSGAAPTGRAALLTGAGGFVGRHLLWRLLEETEAPVYCLIRATTASAARDRLITAIIETGCWQTSWLERIRPVLGDLSVDGLGLDVQVRDRLEQDIGAIYHCGAAVNSLFPYAGLRAANVEATRQLLELAAQGAGKHFHHFSTIGIFDNAPRERSVFEDEVPVGPPPAANGYNCSKWASEILVRRAAKQGLPTSIYRLGRVAWSSRTGQWNENDFVRGF